MADSDQHESLIRRYLLGLLREDELELLEERMMADTEFFNEVLLAEDEMVEQYVRRELSRQDRLKFESSFLATAAGRRQVAYTRALLKKVAGEKQHPFKTWIQHWLRGMGGAFALKSAAAVAVTVTVVVAVAVVGTAWFTLFRKDPVAEGQAALVAVYARQRPTYSRLSGFEYAPFVELMGNAGPDGVDRTQRDRAGLLVQNAANQKPGESEAIHLLGQYYLSIRDFDEAIAQLRKAHELAPNDAKILNDLGGALFEKIRSQGLRSASNPFADECLRSLNRALEINASLADAYFNRALCNELLMQWESAEADWNSYLKLDSISPWAAEAKAGLQRIAEQKRKSAWHEPQFFDDFAAAAALQDAEAGWRALSISIGTRSSLIVERLIDEALDDQARDDQKHVMLLEWAGQIARTRIGDSSISDISERYSKSSRSDLLELQEARKRSALGLMLFGQWKLHEASDAFENASLAFEKLGDFAEALYFRYLEAHCYLRRPDLEAACGLFDDVRKAAQAKSYRWLEARADDGLAEAHFSRSEYSLAIEFARRSLELSRSLSNAACVGRSCVQLSEIYLQLGDYAEAGGFAWEGLQAVNKDPVDPLQSSLPYGAAADLFTAARLDGLATAFQIESLRRALSAGHPVQISFAHAHVGRSYAGLGDDERALEQIKQAVDIAAELPSSESGDVRAYACLCAADLYRGRGELDQAISNYEEALSSYSESGRHNEAFAAMMGKLLCQIRKKDIDQAKDGMLRIGKMIEEFAGEIVEEKNRTLFTESLSEFHDAAIGFACSTLDDPNMTYQYAEMFRARSLLDLSTGLPETTSDKEGLSIKSRGAPLTPDQIRGGVPKEVQLVQYAVLKDRSLVWVVSGNKIQIREIPVSKEELTARVERFVSLCRSSDVANIAQEATSLYEILIQPIALLLSTDKQLCIVPDSSLSGLPFAALKSPRTNRYLVEDFVISGAPSATLFVRCSDWARQKSSLSEERLLSVGDPEFDQKLNKLNRLPDAARCAREVARLYPLNTTLTGAQATELSVTAAMSHSQVINLATHYVSDPGSPMLSKLVLSSDPAFPDNQGADGALHGYELYGMRLPATKLVVLAGCQTLSDEVFDFEGAVGAARPFISAGVPLVIASFWPVDSKATADLVVAFHRQRKPGINSSARALREAQLAMIRSGDYRQAPFYWAAFSLVGGYAEF